MKTGKGTPDRHTVCVVPVQAPSPVLVLTRQMLPVELRWPAQVRSMVSPRRSFFIAAAGTRPLNTNPPWSPEMSAGVDKRWYTRCPSAT